MHPHTHTHMQLHARTTNLQILHYSIRSHIYHLTKNPSYSRSCVALVDVVTQRGGGNISLTLNTEELDQTVPINNRESCEMHRHLSVSRGYE